MGTGDDGWTRSDATDPPDHLEPPTWPPPVPPPPTPKRYAGQPLKTWLLVGGGAVFVAAVLIGSALGDDESGPDAYGAHAACAEFTRDRLKSPSSADFPEYDDPDVSITHGGVTWTVRSFVDADNSFGANVRTRFTCKVRYLSDAWRLAEWSER